MIHFDKIVNKLWKLEGKIIDLDDVSDITDPDFRRKQTSERSATYKILYRLKAEDIIIPIRQGIYYVNNRNSVHIDQITEDRYWSIVKKIFAREADGECFISGNKGLEIHMKDYSAPKRLLVSGKGPTKNLQISSEYSLSVRPITSGKKTGNKNLYAGLKKYTEVVTIDEVKLRLACPELALLDTLLVRDSDTGIDQYLVEKFLKRSSKTLNRSILWELVSLKYITAINRLRSIAQSMKNETLYEMCVEIIAREGGGCFVTGGR